MSLNLSTQQLTTINSYGSTSKYPAMYSYIAAEMKAGRIAGASNKQIYWFDQAAKINASDSSSPASVYIRAATVSGLAATPGARTDLVHVNGISDDIGSNVFADIRRASGIPDFKQQLNADISAAIKFGGMTIGGWGGAFYYWNEPYTLPNGVVTTVGDAIRNNPVERQKFIDGTLAGTDAALQKFGVAGLLSDPSFWPAFGIGSKNLLVSDPVLFAKLTQELSKLPIKYGEQAVRDFENQILRATGYFISSESPNALPADVAQAAADKFIELIPGGGVENESDVFAQSVETRLSELLAGKDTSNANIYAIPSGPGDGAGAASVVVQLQNGESVTINRNGDVSYRFKQTDDSGNVLWTVQSVDKSYQTVLKEVSGVLDTRNYSATNQLLLQVTETPQSNGSISTVTRTGLGQITSTVNVQKIDDNTIITDTIKYTPTGQFQSRNISTTAPDSNGNGNPTNTEQNLDIAGIQINKTITSVVGGTNQTEVYGPTNQLQSTTTAQTFDDGTQLVTVNYPSGFQTIISTDTLGGSRQVEYSVLGDLNIRTITDRNPQGQVTSTSNITPYIEDDPRSGDFNRVIPNTYSIVNTDGAGTITATGLRTVNPADKSFVDNILGSATPDNPAGTYGEYATDPAGVTRPVVQQTALHNLAQSANAFNNAYALIQALQNNQPLPALASGIRLYNDISPSTFTPQLTGVASAIGALSGLYSFDAALTRGDYASAFAAGASAFTVGVDAFAVIVYGDAINAAAEGFGALLGAGRAVSTALPYINIANSLIRGDIGGAAGGVAGLMVSSAITTAAIGATAGTTLAALGAAAGPIGAIAGMVIGTILSSLLEDDPRPFIPTELWSQTGVASVYLNGAGALDIAASGEAYPRNAAIAQLGSLINSLNNIVINHNTGDPINLLALIPQRLTTVNATVGGFVGAPDTTNLTYTVNSVNPATGQSLNPDLYFTANGNGSSQTFNPERPELYFGTTINAYYTQEALSRQAIAPLWEAQTARIQANNLLSNAGLSELERAANLGRLAGTPAPAVAGTFENWNPIALNFGGGLAVTTVASINANSTEFNIDGTADLNARLLGTANPQYQHKTQWLNSTDGYLVLDKNINGTIDNAEELFSNTKVAEQHRGMASLGNWDADGNGLINTTDPLYNQLFVWKDLNADGKTQSAEVTNLAGLGVSSLDYANGTFTQAGQTRQMSTLSLKAETIGRSYVQKPDGIQINTNAGQSTLRVTQLHDLNNLQPNGDGFTTEQGVPAIISVRGNGTTYEGLLDNDRVSNAPNALLTVAGVGNASNGQVSLDAASGTVLFTPNAGFYGAAGFDYVVDGGAYGQAISRVQVNVSRINQAPRITGSVVVPSVLIGYNQIEIRPASGESDAAYRTVPVYSSPSGVITATDADDATEFLTWTVVNQPRTGGVALDNYGRWSFTADAYGPFAVEVRDPSGATARIVVDGGYTLTPPPPPPPPPGGDTGDSVFPIILDLENNGFEFTSVNDSNVFFMNPADGLRHQTAWFGNTDGVLAFDKYGDGVVRDTTQIAFKDYLPGAQTDLQGLAAFDSNSDGIISRLDARWSQLGVWVDGDTDGLSDSGEYQSLEARGIQSISLTSNNQFAIDNGVVVHGMATFTRVDGSTSQVADVTLPYSGNVLGYSPDGSQRVTTVAVANPATPMMVGDGDDLVLGNRGDNVIIARNGNKVISTGNGNDLIRAGDGNNSIYSGAGKDIIVAGGGNNAIYLGAGPKWVTTASGNNLIVGGSGNTVIMAGNGNNTIYAGTGNSVVYANNGDNLLVGGLGRNALIAGDGNNTLMDGGGRADMYAGTGSNTFVVANALSIVTAKAGAGVNTVKTSVNWTLGDNTDILWGHGRNALTLTGNALDNQIIGTGAADTLAGGAGNDTLADSGGAATMLGGTGDDTYIVSNAAARVVESFAEGYDMVKTSVSYAVAANVEKLMATGNAVLTLTAHDDGVTLVANNAGNTLLGGAGADVLQGGAAADTLRGGAGNDCYVLQRGGGRDTVTDTAGAADSVLVRGNLTAADITLTRRDFDVLVGVKNTNDALVLKNWFSGTLGEESSGAVEFIRFENGSPAIDSAAIHSLLDNHAPTAAADSGATQEDATASVTGNVLINDGDIDLPYDSRQQLQVANAGTYAGVYGSLALAANGSYTYTLNNTAANVQALSRDALVNDVFSYTVQDNALDNKTATSTLTISIRGTNDGPQAFVDATDVTEDGVTNATGNLLANDADVDTGDVLTVTEPGVLLGTYGDLSLNANGSYSYALNNAALNVQSLRDGQQVTDTFAYNTTDGLATSASSLAVTVTGSNDAPVAFADVASVKEDAALLAAGHVLANDIDPDVGDSLHLAASSVGTLQGTYGSLTLTENGSYAYALNNGAANVQALGRNAVVTDTFAYTAQDDGNNPLLATSTLTVTIAGANDGPQASADEASVKEDGTVTATGNLLANDTDVDAGDILTVAAPGVLQGTFGDLSLSANGSYSYELNNAALNVQSLRGGQQVTDSFAYSATDGLATSASSLEITVTGTNDAPVAFADAASVKEDITLTATGNVLANDKDVDQGTVLSVATAGTFTSLYGTLTIAANGGYTYTLNNSAAAVQKLGVGQSVTDVFAYTVTDDDVEPLTATANLSITIAGTNDVPIVASAIATQAARENQAFGYTVPLGTFTDADNGDALTYSAKMVDVQGNLQALPGWLSFNTATRAFTGTPGGMAGGSFEFVVTATDLSGASASSRFAINISDEFAGTGATANVITGNNLNNVLNGGSLNETIIGKAGSDTLYGGAGDDSLDGGTGSDLLFGDAGNDVLKFSKDGRWSGGDYAYDYGNPGQPGSGERIHLVQMNRSLDTIDGGTGTDTLLGTSGDDAIILDEGGQRIKNIEVIDAGAGDDVVDLTSDLYALGNVTLYGGEGDDVLWASSGDDAVYGGNGDDELRGSVGNDLLDGGSGEDLIIGGSGADVLDGKTGKDTLEGGTGNDTYLFGRGSERDTLQENDATAGNYDTLQFTGGIATNQIWLRKVSNNLEVSVIGTADKMTISNWYSGGQYRVEEFKTSDGKVLLDSQVQNLVQAMASFAPPAAGQTTLTTARQAALAPLIAANWQ
ncbi:MAG: VCBS domain-containing protein [Polaromonas sp.]